MVWEIIDWPKTDGLIVVNGRELNPGLERLRPLGDAAGVIGINCGGSGISIVIIKVSVTVGGIIEYPLIKLVDI